MVLRRGGTRGLTARPRPRRARPAERPRAAHRHCHSPAAALAVWRSCRRLRRPALLGSSEAADLIWRQSRQQSLRGVVAGFALGWLRRFWQRPATGPFAAAAAACRVPPCPQRRADAARAASLRGRCHWAGELVRHRRLSSFACSSMFSEKVSPSAERTAAPRFRRIRQTGTEA